MKTSSRFLSTALFALVALVSHPALADDLAPAPYRGEPNSVMAKFDLSGSGSLMSFTEGANPTYPLSTVQPGIVADLTGQNPLYQVTLPNYIDDLPLKKMRVQYSWHGQAGDAQTVTINVVPNVGGLIRRSDSTPPAPVPGTANVFHRWDDFEIFPNPDFETIQVEFMNADPRWLIFDTISTDIPEPSSIGLGLLAMLGGVSMRRRAV